MAQISPRGWVLEVPAPDLGCQFPNTVLFATDVLGHRPAFLGGHNHRPRTVSSAHRRRSVSLPSALAAEHRARLECAAIYKAHTVAQLVDGERVACRRSRDRQAMAAAYSR